MTVIASSVADVVASVGGLLFDRRMAGWTVDVLLADRSGERALQILGATTLDLDGDFETISSDPERAATLAVAADIYAADERVREEFSLTLDHGLAEVAVWGDTGQVEQDIDSVCYRLSGAARVFKAQALMAAGIPADSVEATETLFRGGVTTCPSLEPDLVPVG
ncbi:MAG: hypothetical protein ACRDU5_11155 [Mycobacterium sp.]